MHPGWKGTLVLTTLAAVAVAGCLGDAGPLPGPTRDDGPAPRNLTGIARYTGNGTAVPITDATAPNATATHALIGHSGAEPTMGITASGAIFATGSSTMVRSTDGGASWEEVYTIGVPVLGPNTVYRSWDPLMDVDPVNDIVYMDPMFPPLACTELSWSDDDGASWTTNPAVCHPPPMDHQKLFVGLPGPDAPPAAGAVTGTVLYQCYNQLVATECATSWDGGLTWPIVQPVVTQQEHDCGGINGFGEVGPDGVAAVPVASGCPVLHVAWTTDSGLTWTVTEGPPEPGANLFDPEVDFDANGTAYVVWRGSDETTYLARTSDMGATWDGAWRVSPPGVETTMFPTLSVGANGTAAMAFLGTDVATDPNDAPDEAHWHLYIVTTDDATAAEPVFTSYKVTPDDDPVQVGRICTGGIGCDGGRNLLEFIDSEIHPDGTFHVIYTDGCVEDCAADPSAETSTSRELGLAKLVGWTMVREDW